MTMTPQLEVILCSLALMVKDGKKLEKKARSLGASVQHPVRAVNLATCHLPAYRTARAAVPTRKPLQALPSHVMVMGGGGGMLLPPPFSKTVDIPSWKSTASQDTSFELSHLTFF